MNFNSTILCLDLIQHGYDVSNFILDAENNAALFVVNNSVSFNQLAHAVDQMLKA